jgi:uncharacterized protein
VTLTLKMPVQRVVSDPRVRENAGRVALERGPLVYCIEQCDQEAEVGSIRVSDRAPIRPVWSPNLLGGATVLRFDANCLSSPRRATALYRRLPARQRTARTRVTCVPYFLWENRQPGPMAVWLPREP